MDRKAEAIRNLENMGYMVYEDSGMLGVSLLTSGGKSFLIYVSEEEIVYSDFSPVENVVRQMNNKIVQAMIESEKELRAYDVFEDTMIDYAHESQNYSVVEGLKDLHVELKKLKR